MQLYQLRTRSRRGCLVCRRRKVKCDEQFPTCCRCSQLGLACQWANEAQNAGDQPLQRSRSTRACQLCSQRRVKCEMVDGSVGTDCRGCVQAGAQCVRIASRSRSNKSTIKKSDETKLYNVEDLALPSGSILNRMIEAYFQGPHSFCFYAFIHPATFRRLHQQGQLPPALLLAVLATSLRYTDPQNPQADRWVQRSRLLVMADTFSRFSALNLQTILLLARYEWHRGEHCSYTVLTTIATRMAYGLQLNKEPESETLPALVLETRRRLMWSTFILESFPDPGGHQSIDNNISVDPSTITTRFPSGDHTFAEITSGVGNKKILTPQPSDMATFMTSLLVLRKSVLRYSIAYHPRNESSLAGLEQPWLADSRLFSLHQDLTVWYDNLPQELEFTEENLDRISEQGHLTSFVTLHSTFHGVQTDLFSVGYFLRRRLHSVRTPKPPHLSHDATIPPTDFLLHCNVERRRNALRALGILSMTWPRLKQQERQTDPAVSIGAAVAFRILCLEDVPDGQSSMQGGMFEPSRQQIDVLTECLEATSQWSIPTRHLVYEPHPS